MSSDFLVFADRDEPEASAASGLPPWKVAVVDDDAAVHESTAFALKNFALNGRRIELAGAFSGTEGLALLRDRPDTAIVLLDVVMESDDAGLKLARRIRHELGNALVRIILRTGQPGQAPEHQVVVDYDINDYKAKTELTAERLFTTLTSSLRSYEQLKRLDDTRRGLELIVAASSALFDGRSLTRLAEGVLVQLNALLAIDCAGMLVLRGASDVRHAVLASSGSFTAAPGAKLDFERLFAAFPRGDTVIRREGGLTHLYVRTPEGAQILVVLDAAADLTEAQASLVAVFSAKLAIAFDNARLHEDLQAANVLLEERVRRRTAALAEANERLEAQSGLLRRANAFKNEMMGMVAHDLKNPLTVIAGRAERLEELAAAGAAVPEIARQAGQARATAQRMLGIVDGLLADALADSLEIGIHCRRVDLGEIVAAEAAANAGAARAKSQTIETAIEAPLAAYCDPERIAEAVDNLVSNAVKYAPLGGRIAVGASLAGHAVRITVADSGPGLAEEDVARLFGRFQRLSAQPTGGESSTGLGLSIVRRIADLHGGRIEVEPRGPLGGAAFVLSIPVGARPAAS
ncbi:histidine kinase [Aureimonas endophytica]|uniref:histidine kinase n=1 Tax=Aureimonas endophytica TaxID=2027858 RepID=A0A916ZUP0_9HYPH|nr:DUF3369 domain-containing protein [Aureimonas endophytica]GGE15097.1 histidine kinase [Aureimonas endophytica]